MKFDYINRKFFISVCSVALLTVFSLSAFAEDTVNFNNIKFPESKWRQGFLDGLEVGPPILTKEDFFDVAPPPINDSAETTGELSYLKEIANTERTEEAVARIHYENSGVKAHEIFANEGLIHPDNYKTLALLPMIDEDHMYFILERKRHFARARPDQLDIDLVTVIPNPKHAAYPSGHASQSYMVALVLSDFDPENAEKYKQFAVDIAHRREIAGVHYPSDSVAGRKLAVDVLARLHEVPIFEKKYQDAKASYTKPDFSTAAANGNTDVETIIEPAIGAENMPPSDDGLMPMPVLGEGTGVEIIEETVEEVLDVDTTTEVIEEVVEETVEVEATMETMKEVAEEVIETKEKPVWNKADQDKENN